jgi:hypothetical protein
VTLVFKASFTVCTDLRIGRWFAVLIFQHSARKLNLCDQTSYGNSTPGKQMMIDRMMHLS